jgi:hypothetical protein
MNPVLRKIIEYALETYTDQYEAAIDQIYIKMFVTPIQRAYRRRPKPITKCEDCEAVVQHRSRNLCTECYFLYKYGFS